MVYSNFFMCISSFSYLYGLFLCAAFDAFKILGVGQQHRDGVGDAVDRDRDLAYRKVLLLLRQIHTEDETRVLIGKLMK